MKKSLLAGALALALSLTGMGAAYAHLTGSGNKIELTEDVILGDPAAADGLTLNLNSQMVSGYLQLYSGTTLGGETSSRMEFFPKGDPYRPPWINGIYLNLDHNFGMSTTGEILPEHDLVTRSVGKPVQAVADRTKAGEKHTEIVRYADYYDRLWLASSISLQYQDVRHYWDWENDSEEYGKKYQILEDMTEVFSFPVPEDYALEITVTRDENNRFRELNCNAANNEVDAETHYTDQGNWLYFIPELRLADGSLMDYGGTPAGYGIYRLPIPGEGEYITIDDLDMVYPLEEGWDVLNLQADAVGEQLLLVTREEGQVLLRVLDMSTDPIPIRQTIPLDYTGEWYPYFYIYEDFVVVHGDEKAVFSRDENGLLRFEFSVPYLTEEQLGDEWEQYSGWGNANRTYAFDGQRLAGARMDYMTEPWYRDLNGALVEVYDRDGIQYMAHFHSSLDRNPIRSRGDNRECRPGSHDAVTLTWN